MKIEEMIRRKKERNLTYEQIASMSGVPIGTVQKIFSGATMYPRYDTMLALEQVFVREEDLKHTDLSFLKDDSDLLMFRDSAALRKKDLLTIADRDMLPDDRRTELIDGVLYDMAAPLVIHQVILAEITIQLAQLIRLHRKKCRVFSAPCDVRLNKDEHTMVQPDIFLLCDLSKIREKEIYGAPDLVMEILSPSTRKKDQILKLYKYADAGVHEYWTVDPDNRLVTVYLLDELNSEQGNLFTCMHQYTFEDRIPITFRPGSAERSEVAEPDFEPGDKANPPHFKSDSIAADNHCYIDLKDILEQIKELGL